jgi:hypothetical protein
MDRTTAWKAARRRMVAEEALRALGRHTVLVSGRLRRAAYAPLTLPRALAAAGSSTGPIWTPRASLHWRGGATARGLTTLRVYGRAALVAK